MAKTPRFIASVKRRTDLGEWEPYAAALRAEGFTDERVLTEAVDRLTHGDIRDTDDGPRVLVRTDLRDDRSVSQAKTYRPRPLDWESRDAWTDWRERWRCHCHEARSSKRRICSHIIAAVLWYRRQDTESAA